MDADSIHELHVQRPVNHDVSPGKHDISQPPPQTTTTAGHEATNGKQITNLRANIVVLQLATVTFLSSLSSGLITVCIPRMAIDLHIDPTLYYWPLSVYNLTSGSTLLIAGAVADVIGSRPIFLIGCCGLATFILASGLAQTGIQLIMFRAMQGIAVSLCLPTSVGILTKAIAPGRRRNVAFATVGLSQPLGFSFGLVLGGIFVDTIGWRSGWYICAGGNFLCIFIGLWSIPADASTEQRKFRRLKTEIDWIGVLISTVCLALLAYTLVMLSTTASNIHHPEVIAFLVISLALMPAFVYWVHRQEQRHKPALVPNSLWKKLPFTTICLMILLSYGVMQIMELFCSLFWQKVQSLSPLEASIRFLPSMIFAAILNIMTGLIIDKVSVFWLVLITTAVGTASPILMAICSPHWPYWYAAFPAQLFEPLSPEILFTAGMLIVSEAFPDKTQALAGAVFNVVTQFGQSIGLALAGILSDTVSQQHQGSPPDKHVNGSGSSTVATDPPIAALLLGYRAGFWMCTGWAILACCVGAFGLRKVGKVGLKRD